MVLFASGTVRCIEVCLYQKDVFELITRQKLKQQNRKTQVPSENKVIRSCTTFLAHLTATVHISFLKISSHLKGFSVWREPYRNI
jgi:hypothetical protein